MISRIKNLLKSNKLLHFIVTYLRDNEFRINYHLYLKDNPLKKSNKIIDREYKLIRNYWHCPPYHYFRYKLYEKKLTDAELLDYIPPFYFYNIYWESRHIGLDKSSYESKFFQHQLFNKFNIPAIDIVATVKNGKLSGSKNELITINDLVKSHLQNTNDALFFKPEYGRGGNGIMLLSVKGDTLHLNNQPISEDKILLSLSKDEDYLIQKRFIQSKKMSEINECSVNTLRIYTQLKGNKIEVSGCILRMGVNNSFVDNFAQGGIICIVDIDNGNLADFAQTNKVDRRYYEHPHSNYIFKNSKIDNWLKIKSEIVKFACLLPDCKDLGWDVAISDTGFKILEINIQFGLDIQLVYGGMRKILNVNPE